MADRKQATTIEIVTDEAEQERFLDTIARGLRDSFPPPVAFTWPSGVTVQYTPALKWTKEPPATSGGYWLRSPVTWTVAEIEAALPLFIVDRDGKLRRYRKVPAHG